MWAKPVDFTEQNLTLEIFLIFKLKNALIRSLLNHSPCSHNTTEMAITATCWWAHPNSHV